MKPEDVGLPNANIVMPGGAVVTTSVLVAFAAKHVDARRLTFASPDARREAILAEVRDLFEGLKRGLSGLRPN